MEPQAFDTAYSWHNNISCDFHTEDVAELFRKLPRPSRPPYYAYARSQFQYSEPIKYKEMFHNINIPVRSLVF